MWITTETRVELIGVDFQGDTVVSAAVQKTADIAIGEGDKPRAEKAYETYSLPVNGGAS